MDKYFEFKFYTELISIGIAVIVILFSFIIYIVGEIKRQIKRKRKRIQKIKDKIRGE